MALFCQLVSVCIGMPSFLAAAVILSLCMLSYAFDGFGFFAVSCCLFSRIPYRVVILSSFILRFLQHTSVAVTVQKDVARIVDKISTLNFDDYYKAFDPQQYADNDIYPNIWFQDEDIDELFEGR